MGCYGIGVTRTLQAVAEQCHDKDGIIWPAEVAPYAVAALVLNPSHEPSMNTAAAIAGELERRGVDVILDDRDERPGVKFKDADLVGFPVRMVVSERSLAKGQVEIRERKTGRVQMCAVGEAADRVSSAVRNPVEAA